MRSTLTGALLVLPLALAGCQPAGPTTTPQQPGSGDSAPAVSVLELSVGTCLNDVDQPLGQDPTEVPAVPCDEPHQSEVYADIIVNEPDYPGVDAMVQRAQQECIDEFGQFVGLEFAASELNFHFYYPTASSWSAGDRSIYCVVFDPGAETGGTLAGAER